MATDDRKDGILILTEGRSGSNWLGSLLRATGRMGNPGEWLAPWAFDGPDAPKDGESRLAAALDQGRDAGGTWALKLFPLHLLVFGTACGFDPLDRIRARHRPAIVTLRRRDRLRQAISYVRGEQTSQWKSTSASNAEPVYDFGQICRRFFYIDRSYQFWDSYLALKGIVARDFCYEDLVGDPAPFVTHLAQELGVSLNGLPRSELRVQRDALTEEWLERFHRDLDGRNILEFATPRPRRPYATLANALCVLTRRPTRPQRPAL